MELTPDERDEFKERAAIMEFCGGMSRERAERLAMELVLKKRGPKQLELVK